MAQMNLQEFKNWALSQGGNIPKYNDGQYPGQCVSIVNQYCYRVLDIPASAWGDAKNWGANQATLAYFDVVNDIQPGDIVVYPNLGLIEGIYYGHIEIALDGATGLDQNGRAGTFRVGVGAFYNSPRRILRKKGGTPLAGDQRFSVAQGAKLRDKPSLSGSHIDTVIGNKVVNFKGFVHGESVNGTDIWFVGKTSGLYSHASGYTNQGTSGLADLTPKEELKPTERKLAYDGVRFRTEANTGSEAKQTHNSGTIIDFVGWKYGEEIEFNGVKSSIWFVSKENNLHALNLFFTDTNTHDLQDMNPKPTDPTAPEDDEYPEPSQDPDIDILVNKKHPVAEDCQPSDLKDVGNGQKMRAEAVAAFNLMKKAITKKGLVLTPLSGFRTFNYQKQLYDNYVAADGQAAADRYSARPGYSEHHTGLAIDVNNIDEKFENSDAFKWLVENAHKFGFILRYKKGQEEKTGYMYEPWHWRYIGVTIATDMHDKNTATLEDYLNKPGGDYGTATEPEEPTEPTEPEEPEQPVEPEEPTEPDNEINNIGDYEMEYVEGQKPTIPDNVRKIVYCFAIFGSPIIFAIAQIVGRTGIANAAVAMDIATYIIAAIGSIAGALGISHFTATKK